MWEVRGKRKGKIQDSFSMTKWAVLPNTGGLGGRRKGSKTLEIM